MLSCLAGHHGLDKLWEGGRESEDGDITYIGVSTGHLPGGEWCENDTLAYKDTNKKIPC